MTRYCAFSDRYGDRDDGLEVEEAMDLELALIEFFKDSFPSTTECHVISGLSGSLNLTFAVSLAEVVQKVIPVAMTVYKTSHGNMDELDEKISKYALDYALKDFACECMGGFFEESPISISCRISLSPLKHHCFNNPH